MLHQHQTSDSESENSSTSEESDIEKEKSFSAFLNKYLYTSLETVSALPDMDKAHQQLFHRHIPMVHYFICQGVTIAELALVNIEVLEKCFDYSPHQINQLLSCFTFQQIASLDPNTLSICINYIHNLKVLIQHGLLFDDLKYLQDHQFTLLKKCLMHRYLENILKFVNIKQIFGLDNTPVPLANLLKHYPNIPISTTINHTGAGKTGDFSFEYTEHTVNITENNNKNAYFTLSLTKTNESMLPLLKNNMTAENTKFFKFIHNWFLIENEVDPDLEISQFVIFSSDLNCLLHETYHIDFPIEKLQASPLSMLVPFYKEKNFAEFLQSAGCPIEIFRALLGMTKTKLSLLCYYQDIVTELMTHQLDITDFARVNEERLQCILTNYDIAQYALSLVSSAALLGLPPEKNTYSPTFFPAINNQKEKETKKEERINLNCIIS